MRHLANSELMNNDAKAKKILSDKIAEDTEAFLRNGGAVDELDTVKGRNIPGPFLTTIKQKHEKGALQENN